MQREETDIVWLLIGYEEIIIYVNKKNAGFVDPTLLYCFIFCLKVINNTGCKGIESIIFLISFHYRYITIYLVAHTQVYPVIEVEQYSAMIHLGQWNIDPGLYRYHKAKAAVIAQWTKIGWDNSIGFYSITDEAYTYAAIYSAEES